MRADGIEPTIGHGQRAQVLRPRRLFQPRGTVEDRVTHRLDRRVGLGLITQQRAEIIPKFGAGGIQLKQPGERVLHALDRPGIRGLRSGNHLVSLQGSLQTRAIRLRVG